MHGLREEKKLFIDEILRTNLVADGRSIKEVLDLYFASPRGRQIY